jgi:hypothetical protein
MNEIVQMISTVGFPIVAVLGVSWYAKYTNDNYRTDMKEANALHKEEMAQLTTALNNNTVALTKLCDKLNNELKFIRGICRGFPLLIRKEKKWVIEI